MKKILGVLTVALICVLGLCSCATPEQKAVNQDQADRIGEVLDKGKEVNVKGKSVCLYSLTANDITLGNGSGWFKTKTYNDFTKLVQYNNYFEIYREDKVYTFSNTVAGYIVY